MTINEKIKIRRDGADISKEVAGVFNAKGKTEKFDADYDPMNPDDEEDFSDPVASGEMEDDGWEKVEAQLATQSNKEDEAYFKEKKKEDKAARARSIELGRSSLVDPHPQ